MISLLFPHFRACFAPARANPPCFDAVQESSVGHPAPTRGRGQKRRNSPFPRSFIDRASPQATAGAPSSPAADAPAEHRHGSREHHVCFNPSFFHTQFSPPNPQRRREEKSRYQTQSVFLPPSFHHRITGNRVCELSSPRFPHLLLFSSPSLAPAWPAVPRPKRARCAFNDGPARYFDPRSNAPLCSLACAKRLREERRAKETTALLGTAGDEAFRSSGLSGLSGLNGVNGVNGTTRPNVPNAPNASNVPNAPNGFGETPGRTGMGGIKGEAKQTRQMASGGRTDGKKSGEKGKEAIGAGTQKNGDALKGIPKGGVKTENPPPPKRTMPQPTAPINPTIVTTTTTQGKVLQFQLNYANVLYINSKALNIPVNINQMYYLQTEVNGKKVVNAHLMTDTKRDADGNVYYCMVPMIPLQNPSTCIVCLNRGFYANFAGRSADLICSF